MRLSGQIVLTVAVVLVASACSRPGEKRCAKVCEHYLNLYLADKYDEQIAGAADGDARAALEADKAAEYKERRDNPEFGFEACINRCNRRSRGTVSDCVMKAETLKAAKKCDADEGCQIASDAGGSSNSAMGGLLVGTLAVAWLLGHRRRRRRSQR